MSIRAGWIDIINERKALVNDIINWAPTAGVKIKSIKVYV
jgi:hypothetical protein